MSMDGTGLHHKTSLVQFQSTNQINHNVLILSKKWSKCVCLVIYYPNYMVKIPKEFDIKKCMFMNAA